MTVTGVNDNAPVDHLERRRPHGGGQRGREHDGRDHRHGHATPTAGATMTYSDRRRRGRGLFTINATTGALTLRHGAELRERRPTPAATMSMTSRSRSATAR